MRTDDVIVTLLSRWLARHVDTDDLSRELEEIGTEGLGRESAEAVQELLDELRSGRSSDRGGLEMVVRETLEALALGG